MRNIRDILRLRLAAGLSFRQISASTKVSIGAIAKLVSRAEALGLSWPLAPDLDDVQLARLFYPGADAAPSSRYEVPDWSTLHQELKRKDMTKRLLWEEYTQQYPNRCYSYSQFCDRYRQWCERQKRSMRQLHRAGLGAPEKNASSTTAAPPCRSSAPVPAQCVRPRCSWRCWAPRTIRMPRPP